MTGATGNIYCGLHEFESMAFALHLLRPNTLFLDVGANVGSYSILAASLGAKCVTFEPVPSSYACLLENIHLNCFENLVDARNIAVGDQQGRLRMTSGYGAMNHVILNEIKTGERWVEVETNTLNHLAASLSPSLIKVDVEGYQDPVIRGADEILSKDSVLALILEIAPSEMGTHQKVLDFGFKPFGYSPFLRELTPLHSINPNGPNTLYVRDAEKAGKILKSAPAFKVRGQSV